MNCTKLVNGDGHVFVLRLSFRERRSSCFAVDIDDMFMRLLQVR
jgi:hypothetical protein